MCKKSEVNCDDPSCWCEPCITPERMSHAPVVVCASVPYHHHHHHHHHHLSKVPPSSVLALASAVAKFPPTTTTPSSSSSSSCSPMEGAVGISPRALLSLLSGGQPDWGSATLLLDCRPFMAFNRGHVPGAVNVHCPPILKRRSGGLLTLENLVPGRAERERLVSGGYSHVVLYDQRCQDVAAPDLQSNLLPVLTSLRQQSPLLRLPPRLCYLAGGYEAFNQECPLLCVTQQFSPLTSARPELSSSALDEQPVEILPHLLLGSGRHSADLDLLRRLGVSALVNVSSDCLNHFPSLFRYLHIPVQDSASADLTAWFPQANEFIDEVKSQGGRVLVHCQAGRSRSATICLAYLMKTLDLSLDDAFDHVRSRRQVIDPNLNFMRQLQDYRQGLDQAQGVAGVSASTPPVADTSVPQQPTTLTPREAVAPISLPSGLVESGLAPPTDSASLVPPPSPATASDAQCFFFTFADAEFPLSAGSLAQTPEIPLPS